jgi:hypothetical protein
MRESGEAPLGGERGEEPLGGSVEPLGGSAEREMWRPDPDLNRGMTVLQTVALATWLSGHQIDGVQLVGQVC